MDTTQATADLMEMGSTIGTVVYNEAKRILDEMTPAEVKRVGTGSNGEFQPTRLARVLLIVAAERKVEREFGFEHNFDIAMRLVKKAAQR